MGPDQHNAPAPDEQAPEGNRTTAQLLRQAAHQMASGAALNLDVLAIAAAKIDAAKTALEAAELADGQPVDVDEHAIDAARHALRVHLGEGSGEAIAAEPIGRLLRLLAGALDNVREERDCLRKANLLLQQELEHWRTVFQRQDNDIAVGNAHRIQVAIDNAAVAATPIPF